MGGTLPGMTAIALTAMVILIADAPAADLPGQIKPPLTGTARVLVERDESFRAKTYTVSEGGCRLRWLVFDTPPNLGVMQSRSVCSWPLAAQVPALSSILASVLQDWSVPDNLHSFFWGRLTPDEQQDDLGMASRLALAAHRSPSWDARQGRPRSGNINGFAVQLANQEMIYSELRQIFDSFGLDLRLVNAEKVLVLKASELAFFDRLKAAGVTADEKLPFDFLTYFRISLQGSDRRKAN